jgi:hypothetical protein
LNAVDKDWEYLVLTHVSSVQMVDQMDQLCKENPDPWDAVRAIGEAYLLTKKTDRQTAEVASSVYVAPGTASVSGL